MTRSTATLWIAILAIAAGTYALRFSLLSLVDRVDAIPPRAERALEFVPAAVLAALVAPTLLVVDGSPALVGNERLLAGAVAAVVAWRTENVLATVIVGVAVLAIVQGFL